MANVKNNHDALLNVAGVDIRPGATAAVDDQKLKVWKGGHAATIWIEQGLVSIEEAPKSDAKAEREALFARAKELGLSPAANTSTTKLEEAIDAAEKEAAEKAAAGK